MQRAKLKLFTYNPNSGKIRKSASWDVETLEYVWGEDIKIDLKCKQFRNADMKVKLPKDCKPLEITYGNTKYPLVEYNGNPHMVSWAMPDPNNKRCERFTIRKIDNLTWLELLSEINEQH